MEILVKNLVIIMSDNPIVSHLLSFSNNNGKLSSLALADLSTKPSTAQPLSAVAPASTVTIHPRISRALLELQLAETMLASTNLQRRQQHHLEQFPWLLQNLLFSTKTKPTATISPTISGTFLVPTAAACATTAAGNRDDECTNNSATRIRSRISQAVKLASHIGPSSSPVVDDGSLSSATAPTGGSTTATGTSITTSKKRSTREDQPPPTRPLVDSFTDLLETDVLCGRGGKSNHHPGNKQYRQLICQMKAGYRTIGSKSQKTDLSRAIVEHVYELGRRFVKYDQPTGNYVVLTASEARKKTSQALREAKSAKWI